MSKPRTNGTNGFVLAYFTILKWATSSLAENLFARTNDSINKIKFPEDGHQSFINIATPNAVFIVHFYRMTVVHSHSRFWLNCSPIEVPAFGSDDTGRGPTTTTITTQRSIVATSAETVTAKDEHVHNKHGNSHENGSSHEHHNKKKNSSKSKGKEARHISDSEMRQLIS